MKVITSNPLPIKVWAEEVEGGALEQLNHLASLPFTFHHVSAMPDVHPGYGMPIGGVLATKGVVIPNAVGVDIGCGMRAVQLDLKEIDREGLKRILGLIRERVPVGFTHHKEKQEGLPDLPTPFFICEREWESAGKQLGTLGGGNHFIEIQKGNDGQIWAMIHSGSRNLGKQVADFYNKLAKSLNERWFSSIPPKWDLAFLPIQSGEAKAYLSEMKVCLSFALANRALMMKRVVEGIEEVTGVGRVLQEIDIHHNYAQFEHHFGEDVIIHRKGAVRARAGEIGIIPGSQGTHSHITYGLGSPDSFQSCSHGAGRKMGRKEAERSLNLEEEVKKLDDLGILHAIRGKADLDEAAGAYKDIEGVMAQQTDLVMSLVELTPLGVVKG